MKTLERAPTSHTPEASDQPEDVKALVDAAEDRLHTFIATGASEGAERIVTLVDLDADKLANDPDLPTKVIETYMKRSSGSLTRAFEGLAPPEQHTGNDGQVYRWRLGGFFTQERGAYLREAYTIADAGTPTEKATHYTLRLEGAH